MSNRTARGAFIACSGTGDCGGQVQGKACGGLLAKGRVGPRGVVVGHPSRDQITGMGEVAEQRLLQTLIPHRAVEAFDIEAGEGHWFVRSCDGSAWAYPARYSAIRF